MISLLLVSLLSFSATASESRTSHYTCSFDLALAPNDASASIVSGVAKKSDLHFANLIGRGVASCKNQQGFQFNLPTVMAISLDAKEQIPLNSLRANIDPVSVDSDVHKIFDQYTTHIELRQTAGITPRSSTNRSVVVKGLKNDVLIQIHLNLPADFTDKVNISKVDLKLDR